MVKRLVNQQDKDNTLTLYFFPGDLFLLTMRVQLDFNGIFLNCVVLCKLKLLTLHKPSKQETLPE